MKRQKQPAPAEKHVSAKTRAEVLADIRRLEQAGDVNELGGYFIQLAKWDHQPQQYENPFSRYLIASESYLREAAIFCLLFALQIQKLEYRNAALVMAANETEDVEARRWAAAGLAVTYQSTQDQELLQVFFGLLEADEENKSLKSSIAGDILRVWGISSREQSFRMGISASLKAVLNEFRVELQAAKDAANR